MALKPCAGDLVDFGNLEQMSDQLGFDTLDDMEVWGNHKLKNVLHEAEVFVRISNEELGGFLSSSKIPPAVGAGRVSRTIQKELMNYEEDDPADLRPVYGYLEEGDGLTNQARLLDQFGKVVIRLRRRVRERTTWVAGDSMAEGVRVEQSEAATDPIQPPKIKPATALSPINAPDIYSLLVSNGESVGFNPGFLDWQSWVILLRMPVNRRLFRDPRFGIYYSRPSLLSRAGYLEAHIHGGVRTADVDYLVFPKRPSEQIIDLLGFAGIDWKVRTWREVQRKAAWEWQKERNRRPINQEWGPEPGSLLDSILDEDTGEG